MTSRWRRGGCRFDGLITLRYAQLVGMGFTSIALVATAVACCAAPASAATTCANREAPAGTANDALVEIAVLCETNNRRDQAGVAPLRHNAKLAAAARAHARDMVDRGYFDHWSLEGLSSRDRATAHGYPEGGCCGENIAMGYGHAQEAVTRWMDSDGHRANILRDGYAEIGVGVVGSMYVQVFSRESHAPGITGLEPEYQGNAGRDPAVAVALRAAPDRPRRGALRQRRRRRQMIDARTESPASLQFTATNAHTGEELSFQHAGDGLERPPLVPGTWRVCWQLAPADPYAGTSGCLPRELRIEGTPSVRMRALRGARVRILAGAATGQPATLKVQRRVRRCKRRRYRLHLVRRCRPARWRTLRRVQLRLDKRQRLRLARRAPRRPARALLVVPAFEANGVPYETTRIVTRVLPRPRR